MFGLTLKKQKNKVMIVICFHANLYQEVLRSAGIILDEIRARFASALAPSWDERYRDITV